MTVISPTYDKYRPRRLKVVSLGIGVSDETNDTLSLSDNQHLIVGETIVNVGGSNVKSYGLIVDKQGIAINTTVPDRAAQSNVYSAFIEGNVFITGTLVACNIVSDGSGGSGASNAYAGTSNFWIQSTGDRDSIFFPGRVTFGNRGNNTVARNNTHALSIVESADRTIEHAQISIQNTQLSEVRIGILGTSNQSPAVFNTTPGAAIEFHASRPQSYFANAYRRSYWEAGSQVTVAAEMPTYTGHPSNAPHLVIDTDGSVGIHTSRIPLISAEQATPVIVGGGYTFPIRTEKMAFHCDGPAFASNLIIWDHQSNVPVNIDRLFVRRYGATLNPNQIIPGTFVAAPYIFPDQLAVGNGLGAPNPDPDYDLTVNGWERITERLTVDGFTSVNRMEANNAVLLDIASFCNDVYVNRDIIVKESIRLRGGLYVEVPEGPSNVWCNVQFQVAGAGVSNINYIGTGISTPGRLGVGIDPTIDEVNNQLVVTKRAADIYELELYDKSSPTLFKTAFVGHPAPALNRQDDASLVFATPGAFDPDFNFRNRRCPQNFYFYPASSFASRTEPIVNSSNPPVLNIESQRRVGVLTFDPLTALDVRGDIAFTGNLYRIASNTAIINADTPVLGLWSEETFAAPAPQQGSNVSFRGLQYYKPGVASAAIHTTPDPRYGLKVAGGIQADATYSADNLRVGQWVGTASNEAPPATFNAADPAQQGTLFTYKSVGIGATDPRGALLTLKHHALSGAQNPDGHTVLRLYRGDASASRTRIEFAGVQSQPWILQGNDTAGTFEIGNSNSLASDARRRALWTRYDGARARYQTVIGGSREFFTSNAVSNIDPNAALAVDGDVSVVGSVRVTGQYYMNGSLVVNSNIAGSTVVPSGKDDVVIAGRIIRFHPTANPVPNTTDISYGFVAVGYNDLTNLSYETSLPNDPTPFRVLQSNAEWPTIARFRSTGVNALCDIQNRNGRQLRFGIYNDNFAFLDKDNNSYLSFDSGPSGQRYFSLNRQGAEAVNASLHIHNTDIGTDMLRLTRFGAGADSPNAAPEMELEKRIVIGAETAWSRWVVHGPDAYKQKLSFIYGTGSVSAGADPAPTRTELLSLTNDGCLGIGNTIPEYALDVVGSGKRGSIRMLNTGANPSPQLIFQSDSNVFGVDASTDYRFYASNNHFVLDSENVADGYHKLMDFGSGGTAHLGLSGADADARYALNVGGPINCASTLFVDGNPVFTTESDAQDTTFRIQATNVYLQPTTSNYGGVVLNGSQPTSNLFHLYSGQTGTMTVYDSLHEKALLHFRTQQNGAGSGIFNRIAAGMSNRDFVLAYASNTGRASFVNDDIQTGFSRLATVGPHPSAPTAGGAAGKGLAVFNGDLGLGGNIRLHGTAGASRVVIAHASNTAGILANTPANILVPGAGAIAEVVGDQQVAMALTATGTQDLLRLRTPALGTTTVFTAGGRLGIGTAALASASTLLHLGTPAGTTSGSVVLQVDTGIARVPTLQFTDSTGVRLATPAPDTLTVATASAERLRVSANGNVGIGTSAPGARLHISVGAETETLPLVVTATADAPAIAVSAAGNVGIGTTAPTLASGAKFHVHGGASVFGGDLLPTNSENYDLGTANSRWRTLYLSGQTMDLGGTTFSRDTTTGAVRLLDAITPNTLRPLITDSVTIGDSTYGPTAKSLKLKVDLDDPESPLKLELLANGEVTPTVYAPILSLAGGGAGGDTNASGLAVGIPSAQATAFVHIKNTSDSNTTLLIDRYIPNQAHALGSNPAIFTAHSNANPVFTVAQSGAIQTSFNGDPDPAVFAAFASNNAFTMSASNLLPAAILHATQQVQGPAAGDFLVLRSPSNILDGSPGPMETKVRITALGQVGLGPASSAPYALAPSTMLAVDGGDLLLTNGYASFGSNVGIAGTLDVMGDIYSQGNLVTTSDARLKTDLHRIQGALDKVSSLSGYTFTMDGRPNTGLIAQEVLPVLPEVVTLGREGYMGVAYPNMMGLIVEAIKELRQEVADLKKRMA